MRRKNLVWVVFDSLRADRSSVGEDSGGTTPALRRLGDGADSVADTCFAHAIWSQPSVASMMTGTLPSTHGSGCGNETLPTELPTVAERLSAAGYQTVGVSGNPYFSPATGADRGFDSFDTVSGVSLLRTAGVRAVGGFLRRLRRVSGGVTLDRRKHSPDYLLTRIVRERLAEAGDEPVFLAAHCYGAHHPYYPAPAVRDGIEAAVEGTADGAVRDAFELTTNVYETIATGALTDERRRRQLRAVYDAQLRQVDGLIDRLVADLDRLGIADETILVVTGDHGDLLGEYGLCSHKLVVHDGLAEVPIAVRGSELLADTDLGVAQHADVMRTLLAELGAETTGMQGVRLDETDREAAIVQRGAETYRRTMAEVTDRNPEFACSHAPEGFVSALRTTDWKYVRGSDRERLYDVTDETTDVAGDNPAVVERLSEELDERLAAQPDPVETGEGATFDESAKRRLADLGYVVE